MSHARDIVPARPQTPAARVVTLETRVLLEELDRADALECAHDVDGSDALVSFEEHVNVIVHGLEGFDLVAIVVGDTCDDLL